MKTSIVRFLVLNGILLGLAVLILNPGLPLAVTCLAIGVFIAAPGVLVPLPSLKIPHASVYRLFSGVIISITVFILSTILMIIADRNREPASFVYLSLFFSNVGLLVSVLLKTRHDFSSSAPDRKKLKSNNSSRLVGKSVIIAMVMVGFISFVMLVCYSVPMLYDNETFHIGSAYGLIEEFKPVIWPSVPDNTFKKINYSRPPLSHLFSAWSILLAGRLDETELFYRAVFLPLEQRPLPRNIWIENKKSEYPDVDIAMARGGKGKGVRVFVETSIPVSSELLWAARIPHAMALLISLCPLWFLLKERGNPMLFCLFCLLFYLSIPEILIRGISASSEPMSYMILMFLIYFYLDRHEERQGIRDCYLFIAAVIAFWINQKTMVFGFGLVLWRFTRGDTPRKILDDKVLQGFLAGLATYFAYGLWCDPVDFFHAFWGEQGLNRFLLWRVPPPEDRIYPDVVNLWFQFNTFIGSPLLLLGLGALTWISARDIREREAVMLFWFIVTAFLGSLIDRRMTRHLTVAIIPLFLPLFLLFSAKPAKQVSVFYVILGFMFIMNCLLLVRIIGSFLTVSPLPAW